MSLYSEQTLYYELLNKLNEKEALQTNHVTSHLLPPEEYAENVGYIRAIREAEQELKSLLKKYYPDLRIKELK